MKRTILITAVLVTVFLSVSMVSAGLFDFMGDDSGTVGGEIEDDSADYKLMLKIGMESDEIVNVVCMDWDGKATVKLTNATDGQKQIIKDNIDDLNITFNYKEDFISESVEPYDVNASLDGDTLVINYHADCRVDTDSSSGHYVYDNEGNEYKVNSNIDSASGKLSLKSGNITISGETPVTIVF